MRKNSFLRLPLVWCMFTLLVACIEDPSYNNEIINATIPTMGEQTTLNGKKATSVTLTSSVTKANGYEVTERGFCWSLTSPAVISGTNSLLSGKGLGEYQVTIEKLSENTTYYIRPFAKNLKGVVYGSEVSVTTNDGLGVLNSLNASEISASSAVVCGLIVEPGEGEALRVGCYYSLDEHMATKDSILGVQKGDTVSCTITNLSPLKKYYYKIFVTNRFGTFTSEPMSFETADGLSTVKDLLVTSVGYTQLTLSAAVVEQPSLIIKAAGFCVGTTEQPKIENSLTIYGVVEDGIFKGEIIDLLPNTSYFVRAFAINQHATSYGEQLSVTTKNVRPLLKTLDVTMDANVVGNGVVRFNGQVVDEGKTPVTDRGFCWSTTNPNPSINDNVQSTEDISGAYQLGVSGLKGNVNYYVSAYAKNGDGVAYGNVIRFLTPQVLVGGLAIFPGSTYIQRSPVSFMIDNQAFLLGGDVGNGYSDNLWSYNILGDQWTQLKSQPHGELKWQTVVSHMKNAYVLGGIDKNYKRNNDFYKYNSLNNMWYELPSAVDSSYSSVGCAHQNRILYIGGMTPTASNRVRAFDLTANSWQLKNPFPVSQYGGVAFTIGDTVYAGLGKNDAEQCNRTLWRSVGALTQWVQETVCNELNGGVIVSARSGKKIYLLDESYTFFEYNTGTKVWKKKSSLPVTYHKIHCMYVVNEVVYIGMINSPNTLVKYYPFWDN